MENCYLSKDGGLNPLKVRVWLNVLLPKLKDEGIECWLAGGVMEEIYKCKGQGIIIHNHGDIDFLIPEKDKQILIESNNINTYLVNQDFKQTDQGFKIKYTYDKTKTEKEYSIEFILLKNKNSQEFESAINDGGSKTYPKRFIGKGTPCHIEGVKCEVLIPDSPEEFLNCVKYSICPKNGLKEHKKA